jgi:hypothetical protein
MDSSGRQICRDVAAGYKRLALDEERLRKEPLRSKERRRYALSLGEEHRRSL